MTGVEVGTGLMSLLEGRTEGRCSTKEVKLGRRKYDYLIIKTLRLKWCSKESSLVLPRGHK